MQGCLTCSDVEASYYFITQIELEVRLFTTPVNLQSCHFLKLLAVQMVRSVLYQKDLTFAEFVDLTVKIDSICVAVTLLFIPLQLHCLLAVVAGCV